MHTAYSKTNTFVFLGQNRKRNEIEKDAGPVLYSLTVLYNNHWRN